MTGPSISKKLPRGLGATMLCLVGLATTALAAPPTPPAPIPQATPAPPPPASPSAAGNPICVRLEGQLASVNAGSTDPTRSDQVKRAEDAVAKQQADLDRTIEQAHKQGCAGTGFLSLFSSFSSQCGPITSQIQQMRGNLDRMTSDLEQLKSSTGGQDSQRRALIGQLAQNNCGAQYTTAANEAGPSGFLDKLFGGGSIVSPGGDGAPSGTFHTVCVRSCDGYYFPISYSTVPSRFPDDERACQKLCPAAEVSLYSYRNPGEDMQQAVATNGGQPYTALPNAFRYRKEFTAACSCRKPGQSWADALKDADDSSTLQGGDIVVTDQNAKTLSAAPQPKPVKGATPQPAAATGANPPAPAPAVATPPPGKRTVRTVGPPFVAQ